MCPKLCCKKKAFGVNDLSWNQALAYVSWVFHLDLSSTSVYEFLLVVDNYSLTCKRNFAAVLSNNFLYDDDDDDDTAYLGSHRDDGPAFKVLFYSPFSFYANSLLVPVYYDLLEQDTSFTFQKRFDISLYHVGHSVVHAPGYITASRSVKTQPITLLT